MDSTRRIESTRPMREHDCGLYGPSTRDRERPRVGEYEVKVGIEWSGEQDLIIQTVDELNFVWEHGSIPLPRFVPVVSTVRNDVDHATFITQCRELALDVVNQGGVQDLRAIVGAEVE